MLLYESSTESSSKSVTMRPQSNIYEAGAADIRALFEAYVDGNSSRIALALSESPLAQPARDAVEKSLAAFGYGNEACSFATLRPYDPTVEGGDIELDPQSIFLLVEALDPIMIVIADEKTARLVAQAYRAAYDLDAPARVFGRPTAVFRNLPELVSTDEGKQKAWRILKAFPKR